MITSAELQSVSASMQHIVDRGQLPEFDRIECDEEAREVIFLWEQEKLAVIVELDADLTTQQQLDATFAAQMSMN